MLILAPVWVCAAAHFPPSLTTYYSCMKPKHGSKAREIGRAEVTEMAEDDVEDRRTIELDVF